MITMEMEIEMEMEMEMERNYLFQKINKILNEDNENSNNIN
jgi:hypothetical protein